MPFGEGMDNNVDPAEAFETKGFIRFSGFFA